MDDISSIIFYEQFFSIFRHVLSSTFFLVFTGFSGVFIRLFVPSLFITFLLNVTKFVTKIVTMKKLLPGKDNSFLICEGDFGIAEYASPERAKEVLNDMFQKYAAGEKAYIMPEE